MRSCGARGTVQIVSVAPSIAESRSAVPVARRALDDGGDLLIAGQMGGPQESQPEQVSDGLFGRHIVVYADEVTGQCVVIAVHENDRVALSLDRLPVRQGSLVQSRPHHRAGDVFVPDRLGCFPLQGTARSSR